MFKILRFSLFLFGVLLCIFACEQENTVQPLTKLEARTLEVLQSSKFKNLGIAETSLAAGNFTSPDETVLGFPLKNTGFKKGVLAYYNDQSQLVEVLYYENYSGLSSDEMKEAFLNDRLNTEVKVKTERGASLFAIQNSELVARSIGSVFRCGKMTQTGGVAWCFGTRFQRANWFDRSICVIDFGMCYFGGLFSCYLSDCIP